MCSNGGIKCVFERSVMKRDAREPLLAACLRNCEAGLEEGEHGPEVANAATQYKEVPNHMIVRHAF